MDEKRHVNPIFLTQTVIRIIVLNVLFIGSNLPLVAAALLFGPSTLAESSFLFFILSLTLGPSLIALFRSSFKAIELPDAGCYRVFFTTYIQSFSKEMLPLMFIQLVLFFLSFFNLAMSLFPVLSLLAPVYLFSKLVLMLLFPILSLEIALFQNTFQTNIKNALIILFKKPLLPLFTVIYAVFVLLLVNEFPASLLLFVFSLFTFLFTSFSFNDLQHRINQRLTAEKDDLPDEPTSQF
ncbi:hypothetical protein [Vagococcus acidifermentans]|uniref:DUF624 domain-containing protein n=1 Tax=Vagococcus acidifermentans TaxID=564710 RepID=A0A430B301_9ENTE|nr:hypothetical protein [Vagococcus acidifermentans]RSU14703.1 hypothetical protein CBF27_01630 [Vagococcus acidifermentans]